MYNWCVCTICLLAFFETELFLNLFNLYSFNLINFEMFTHIYNNNINIMNMLLFYHNYFTLNCYVVSL